MERKFRVIENGRERIVGITELSNGQTLVTNYGRVRANDHELQRILDEHDIPYALETTTQEANDDENR